MNAVPDANNAVQIVTPGEVLQRGLLLVGFPMSKQNSVRRSKNLERFCSHFGSKPAVYAAIWSDMQTTDIAAAAIDLKEACLEHLLIAAYFLKCYPVINQAEAVLQLSESTIRKWVWTYVQKLQALKLDKIVFPVYWNRTGEPGDEETTFTLTVDGVHCRIQEPTHGQYSKNPAFYSHKFKQAGLGYEVAMSIYENKCVWINGPFPAGQNDLSIFRSALKERMTAGKLGIADKGYRGESALLTIHSSHDTDEVREFKSRALARHEKFNGQLKNFGCLKEQFRHGIAKHQMCFDSVAVICQYQLENGSPLMVV